MKLPVFGLEIDERFLMHRLKSTSLAGIVGALVAAGLWAYRYYIQHVFSWDLFAVVVTIAVVKVAAMAWYRLRD
jgi:Kef-type K+ transport system membrane component KefB